MKAFSTADELEEIVCGSNSKDEEWTNAEMLK
jgi:hypothetical protein